MNHLLAKAIQCFEENRGVEPRGELPNWNLYEGLAALAQGIGLLEDEVRALRQQIHDLESRANQIRPHGWEEGGDAPDRERRGSA